MTPDEARDLLAGTTPAADWWHSVKGGWVRHLEPVGIDAAGEMDVSEDDAALIVAAPTLAAMVAGMREEWGVKWDDDPNGPPDWGFPTRAAAEKWEKESRHYGPGRGHIIRRYVTELEEIK